MAKKRRKVTKKRKKKQDAYVHAIVIMIISILLAVLIYMQSGYIGRQISPMLGGLMGWIKYLVPIGTFIIGISLIKEEKEFVMPKMIQYLVIILCVCAFMTSMQFSGDNKLLNINDEFSKIVTESYDLGEDNIGGGVFGALVAVPLTKLVGPIGANVLLVGATILLVIFTFGIKPAELIDKISTRLQETREYEDEEDEEEIVRPKVKKEKKPKEKKVKKPHSVLRELGEIGGEEDEKTFEQEIPVEYEEKKTKAQLKIEEIEPEKNPDYIEANLFKETEQEKEDNKKQVLQLEHAQVVEDQNYEFPPIALLEVGEKKAKTEKKVITDNALKLQKTLYSFGVSAKVEDVAVGPAITRYELKPAEGVRVSKIANLADDIALNLAAQSIRIEAPIPGKQAVGIEIPNKDTEMVHLRDVIDSEEFVTAESKLSMGLGKDVSGSRVIADIAKMPHLLVAGSTGSGKSVCINTLITSLIYKAKPSEVKLVMVDPKIVELSVYNGIPHLLIPVVTDPRKAAGALAWAVQEMEDRYAKFAAKGVRDIKGYNKALEANTTEEEQNIKMPQIVIIIDELADLMMVAAKDVEDAICRLAQKARAAGMHLVIATQRPSVDVITGLIKANIPSRIAFAVSSQIDSRTILDMTGAEKLLGKGDMLYYPTGVSKPTRVQGTFVSDQEVEKIVDFLKRDGETTYNEDIIETIEKANKTDKEISEQEDDDDVDPRLEEAIEEVIANGQASTSFIQRRLKVGYARARKNYRSNDRQRNNIRIPRK